MLPRVGGLIESQMNFNCRGRKASPVAPTSLIARAGA